MIHSTFCENWENNGMAHGNEIDESGMNHGWQYMRCQPGSATEL